ncbi:glycoside hydrolase family 16 protein [Cylindrobasidium torrendii FP15055 ss-10]|uniref:Glycoside hydrolase family 16 protein n=1 Tax=Cylindrobasidium torrendii FP15055 ss-10 TaxID=1314674 RepID=A0A0D7BML2_9AGAR|nr:glycoside hydrolase family 16 protein [Cylindrobasidium torrendii FP15055 ss-10]
MSRLLKSLSFYSVSSTYSSQSTILPLSAPPAAFSEKTAETPYDAASEISEKRQAVLSHYSLSADPESWGSNLNPRYPEADDALHNPIIRDGKVVDDVEFDWTSSRGWKNVGTLVCLGFGLLSLFVLFPVITFYQRMVTLGENRFNVLGVNASGQVPQMSGGFSLIDPDTPKDVYTKTSRRDKEAWQLVFSDEFNTDGRSFYPGEDPYWEAEDLHYWATGNLEWYDPSAVTTRDGALAITMSRKENHGLDFTGGLLTSWNKFCFTGGYVEAAVQLPGANNILGLWPAVWTMGNLGRAGYGATLEGTWPYSYDSCDVGTAPNQTMNGLPESSLTGGNQDSNGELSYLPGQRLSRCTCAGQSHPGPMHDDGTFVGRSAPEIDILEAQISGTPLSGQVSQSGQWAPFNADYQFDNSTDNFFVEDPTVTILNGFKGNAFQQSTSFVTDTNPDCYFEEAGCYSVYGFEYKPGYEDAYIEWVVEDKTSWRVNAAGLGPDTTAEISARPIPQEPMYILLNLGISFNFVTDIDFEHLKFPTSMLVDYVRVYQDPNAINIGCDPENFPTKAYIDEYIEAYTNYNLTTWRDDFGQPFPKSSFVDGC